MPFYLSNTTVGILNFFSFLFSIPIIISGVWLGRNGTTACERFLDDPIMFAGVLFIIASLAGLIGFCCSVWSLLWLYLAAMIVIIALGAAFTAFVLIITSGGSGNTPPGKGSKEHRLGNHSKWFQKRVNSSENLSPLQSGCCKPSDDCGFSYVRRTNWTATSTSRYNNPDCRTWDNDRKRLCFECESCKAALVENFKVRWRKVAYVSLSCRLLVLIYSIGCCAFRNTKRDPGYL